MEQNYNMIDISGKSITSRRARARGSIYLVDKTIELIKRGESPKGDILKISEVAGIMATKNTSQILPLCHPLLLNSSKVWFEIYNDHVDAFCEVSCDAKTGVEMEALVGVNTALLTIYDLAKAVDPVIEMRDIYLEQKMGGKSGNWYHPNLKKTPPVQNDLFLNLKMSVCTLSDRASRGEYEDLSGNYLKDYLLEEGGTLAFYNVIPDSKDELKKIIFKNIEDKVDVLLLTGGTGISKSDITPDVVSELAGKELVGFGELQRSFGSTKTKLAWLSRSSAYIISNTLVILFPGSLKGARDGMASLSELIPHAIKMMRGEGH